MADIEILNLDDLTELLVDYFQNLFPGDDVSRNSDNWKRVRSWAGGLVDNAALIQAVDRDIMADTAKGTRLERIGSMFGVTRKGAIKASGTSCCVVRATGAASWDETDPLVHASGLRYFPTGPGTTGGAGSATISVIAETGGSAGNIDADDEFLTWESTPTNLEDEVEISADITGGADQEGDGALRTRILNRMAQPAMGGSANDWEQWILESSDDIATGYVWPNRNGLGSVDIVGLKSGSGAARLLSAGEQTALLDYVDGERPVAATARVLDVTTETQAVEIHVQPTSDPQYARDWNDGTPLVVSTYVAGTRTLTFTTDRPESMGAGDRIVIDGTSGVELEIESLSSTDAVVLVSDKGETISGTDTVYAGGPLITPIRDAVLALFDSLGPRRGDFGSWTWEDSLRLSTLFETVQTFDGVLDTEIVMPAATVEPTAQPYPYDADVNLLIAGDVLIRYEDL